MMSRASALTRAAISTSVQTLLEVVAGTRSAAHDAAIAEITGAKLWMTGNLNAAPDMRRIRGCASALATIRLAEPSNGPNRVEYKGGLQKACACVTVISRTRDASWRYKLQAGPR